MKMRFALLDPTAEADVREMAIAPRLSDLQGKRLGILWNEKPNGDVLLSRLQGLLEKHCDLGSVLWRQKGSAEKISTHTLEELANGSDFVLNALAD
jgi:hypothetical protein